MVAFLTSPRLQFARFTMADADDVFDCITPGITRFLPWEAPDSLTVFKAATEQRLRRADPDDFTFVIRRRDDAACVGLTSLERARTASPDLGIWLREVEHGKGFGHEAVRTVAAWAHRTFGSTSFLYPVAEQNASSRRIAEKLGGEIIGTRTNPKYRSVVYRIPWTGPQDESRQARSGGRIEPIVQGHDVGGRLRKRVPG